VADTIARQAGELFDGGFYCAESVLMALAEAQGVHSDLIPRIATGFCSGLSRTCGLCGALSGAIMAMGIAKGRNAPSRPVDDCYVATQELLRRFEQRFGSSQCRDLTGCDLGTPEGQRRFLEGRVIEQCQGYVEAATEIALAVLREDR
jgi:C_GCAxxG_C_C family probable redox protein